MNVVTAMALQERLSREITGLQVLVDQLAQPATASTPAGLKSGLVILARSLLRTNRVVYDIVHAEVERPTRNPFESFFR